MCPGQPRLPGKATATSTSFKKKKKKIIDSFYICLEHVTISRNSLHRWSWAECSISHVSLDIPKWNAHCLVTQGCVLWDNVFTSTSSWKCRRKVWLGRKLRIWQEQVFFAWSQQSAATVSPHLPSLNEVQTPTWESMGGGRGARERTLKISISCVMLLRD